MQREAIGEDDEEEKQQHRSRTRLTSDLLDEELLQRLQPVDAQLRKVSSVVSQVNKAVSIGNVGLHNLADNPTKVRERQKSALS